MKALRIALATCCLVFFCLAAGGFAFAGPDPGFSSRTIRVSGIERAYLVRVPSVLPAAGAPVVVMLHGHGGNAKGLIGEGKMRAAPYKAWIQIADLQGIVLVAPDGLPGSNGKQGWNDCREDAVNPKGDDVVFLSAVVEAVGREVSIDRSRVFFAGTSNGGHMALRMAVERPDLAAAVAAVAAAMPARSECKEPKAPVRVLFMNGTSDPLVPYNGGAVAGREKQRGTVLSAEASVEVWRRLAGVSGPPVKIQVTDTDKSDDSRVEISRYMKDAIPVVALYRVEGGGHTEPSARERYGPLWTGIAGAQNGDIEMAMEMWDFFSAK